MEAIALVGLVGSVASIGDVVSKVIRMLCHLQTKYKNANLTVSSVIGQLSILNAALNQISEWISTSLSNIPRKEQLIEDLTVALDGCRVLILVLDVQFSNLDKENDGRLSTTGKAVFLWREGDLKEYLIHLGNQIAALHLLLTALQCRSLSEQSALLKSSDSRRVFSLVKDDTSSLLITKGSESCSSQVTETSEQLDTIFDFDREIVNSKAYQMAMRSHIRQLVAPSDGFVPQVKDRVPIKHNYLGDLKASDMESVDVQNLGEYRSPITKQITLYAILDTMFTSGWGEGLKFTTVHARRLARREAHFLLTNNRRYPDRDPPLWAKGTLLVPEEQRLKAQSDVETWEKKALVDEDEDNSIQITRLEWRHASVIMQLTARLQGESVTWEVNMADAGECGVLRAVVVHISKKWALAGWIPALEIGLHKKLSTFFVRERLWIRAQGYQECYVLKDLPTPKSLSP